VGGTNLKIMRILLVSEDIPAPSMGGLAKHVLALARALVADGHRVDLMGNDDHPPTVAAGELDFGGRFLPELSGQFAGWKEMSLGVFMPPKRSAIARGFARSILRRAADYDVIHYHGHLPNVARYLPASLNFIQTRHDQGSDCLIHTRFRRGAICRSTDTATCAGCRTQNPNWLQRQVSSLAVRRFRDEVKEGFRRHKTVFVSDMLQANLKRSFGDRSWGVTVHNFIDTAPIRALAAAKPTLPSTPQGKVRVFIASKLYPAKGVDAFLAAIARRGGTDTLEIEIAGDGGDEAALRTAHPDVHFLGWQDSGSTLQHAAHAHAVIVPSVWEEPCASTVLEALLLGKTVFALRRGGTPELTAYASGPDQLRLHDSMDALADALLAFEPRPDYTVPGFTRADAQTAAGRLLALYRLPPGPIAEP
jgi:glycogen synthase